MRFILTLDRVPATGDELAHEIEKGVAMVVYNIGPEPLRFTVGPIYGGDGNPRHNQRCGTWEVAE